MQTLYKLSLRNPATGRISKRILNAPPTVLDIQAQIEKLEQTVPIGHLPEVQEEWQIIGIEPMLDYNHITGE